MTATVDAFPVSATFDAYEDEGRIFTRTWNRRIPRDGCQTPSRGMLSSHERTWTGVPAS